MSPDAPQADRDKKRKEGGMRETYKNGDKIDLVHNGCDGCSPCMIQGVLCHEHGCPDAWKDEETQDDQEDQENLEELGVRDRYRFSGPDGHD